MEMEIYSVHDEHFRPYGRVMEGLKLGEFLERLEKTPVTDGAAYVPMEPLLQNTEAAAMFRLSGFGGLPVQAGYCNGHNQTLNAVEYHRSSEINVAGTDLILLLGRQQEIEEDLTYDTARLEAFFVPAGTAVEIYATTLHYAPCGVDGKAFRCAVILPEGTNTELTEEEKAERVPAGSEGPSGNGEERLLFARNKWLIAHREAGIPGAFCGLKGENISLA